MPYIKQKDRDEMFMGDAAEYEREPKNVGELNYCISSRIHTYLEEVGLCYKNINAVIGVLECAKLELYRQIATPYEDIKKRENSSVSELDREKKDE